MIYKSISYDFAHFPFSIQKVITFADNQNVFSSFDVNFNFKEEDEDEEDRFYI